MNPWEAKGGPGGDSALLPPEGSLWLWQEGCGFRPHAWCCQRKVCEHDPSDFLIGGPTTIWVIKHVSLEAGHPYIYIPSDDHAPGLDGPGGSNDKGFSAYAVGKIYDFDDRCYTRSWLWFRERDWLQARARDALVRLDGAGHV